MKENIKPCVLMSPLPVAMVTVGDFENANIITIAWTGVVCSNPPRVYISVRPERHSHKILMDSRQFVINLTDTKLTAAADFCGFKSGRECDKFDQMQLTKVKADLVSSPLIAESPINLECKVFDVVSLGSHDMFLADIVAVHVNSEILTEGKVNVDRADLVTYQHGEYYQVGKHLARFGFSIQRKFVKKHGKGKEVDVTSASYTKRTSKRASANKTKGK